MLPRFAYPHATIGDVVERLGLLLLLSLLLTASGCSGNAERHEIEETRACLEDRGLRVQHPVEEHPPQLVVFHPRTGEFVELIEFHGSHREARSAAERPAGRLAIPPREAINNVVIVGFWNDRGEIRACLKP